MAGQIGAGQPQQEAGRNSGHGPERNTISTTMRGTERLSDPHAGPVEAGAGRGRHRDIEEDDEERERVESEQRRRGQAGMTLAEGKMARRGEENRGKGRNSTGSHDQCEEQHRAIPPRQPPCRSGQTPAAAEPRSPPTSLVARLPRLHGAAYIGKTFGVPRDPARAVAKSFVDNRTLWDK